MPKPIPDEFDNGTKRRLLRRCIAVSAMSPDPSTKLGAVLVGADGRTLALGANKFPTGIKASAERLNDRDMKLKLVVHAEMDALLFAAKEGRATEGSTLFFAATDKSGLVWGGAPCTRCSVELIAAGVRHIISPPRRHMPSRWHEDTEFAQTLLVEAGVTYEEVPFDEPQQ